MGLSPNPEENAVKKSITEALKEFGRYMLSIGVVDSLIALFQLVQGMINTNTGDISINWNLLLAFTLFSMTGAVIRALDKLKHEYQKATNPDPGQPQGFIGF